MRVFISWSGDESKEVAELLGDWLGVVIQAIDPWVSTRNIDKGSPWFGEIAENLSDTNFGIICLTPENLNSPWILFEAGALYKGLSSSRLYTLLIGLDNTDVADPLGQFNHTQPNKQDLFRLVESINSSLEEKIQLPAERLKSSFDGQWDNFESSLATIREEAKKRPKAPVRTRDQLLKEILESNRRIERSLRRSNQTDDQIDFSDFWSTHFDDDHLKNRYIFTKHKKEKSLDSIWPALFKTYFDSLSSGEQMKAAKRVADHLNARSGLRQQTLFDEAPDTREDKDATPPDEESSPPE